MSIDDLEAEVTTLKAERDEFKRWGNVLNDENVALRTAKTKLTLQRDRAHRALDDVRDLVQVRDGILHGLPPTVAKEIYDLAFTDDVRDRS